MNHWNVVIMAGGRVCKSYNISAPTEEEAKNWGNLMSLRKFGVVYTVVVHKI